MTEDRFGIVGKVVARTYRVESVVAEGGFGVVYRADHKGFRAKVALKCLKIPSNFNEVERQRFLEQFRSEAEVLFRLSGASPHIVRPLHVDAFHTDDRQLVPFLALEWLEGRTLGALIAHRSSAGKPPLTLDRLVRLLHPVAQALVQAHNLSGEDGRSVAVVHRDLKPENIFITRAGDQDIPKLLDFGISKAKSTGAAQAGQMSQVTNALSAFSPAYAAPEQWSPKKLGQTGPWTDVWGLALTLVEAAKGADVLDGEQAEMMSAALDTGRRPTPRREGIFVSDAVETVFERALAVDPRDRYPAIAEFWDDLVIALGLRRELGTFGARPPSLRAESRGAGLDSAIPPLSSVSSDELTPMVSRAGAPEARVPLRGAPQSLGRAPLPSSAGAGSIAVRPRLDSSAQGPRTSRAGAATGLELQAVSRRPRSLPRSLRPERSLWKALSPAFSLFVLSLAVTLLDRAYAETRGLPLNLGPIRTSWIAGAIMIAAIAHAVVVIRRDVD